jgi:hypothetical protein
MPIKPEKKELYSKDWGAISLYLRDCARWRCELCFARQGFKHPVTGGKVVLTCHHINGDPTDNRKLNLLALCQRCHNKLDQPFRHPRKAKGNLFEEKP